MADFGPWFRDLCPCGDQRNRVMVGQEEELIMHASVGDRIVIKGHALGEHGRDGEVLETRGAGGEPPYLIRWSDNGATTLFFPGPDAAVQHLAHDAEKHT